MAAESPAMVASVVASPTLTVFHSPAPILKVMLPAITALALIASVAAVDT